MKFSFLGRWKRTDNAIFESTLNPETRRQGGMHYTSIENIHKVIDPLFLDVYREQFRQAMAEKQPKRRKAKLKELQHALASGRYFDPACGSGNFLTESYLSLRRLENDILRETITDKAGTGVLGFDFADDEEDFVQVSIQQFYGIEINDFAVSVAKTAMWIAESQMFNETEDIIHKEMDFLPLHTNSNIHEGNALRMDWREVLEPADNVKIMGNPPFVGSSRLSEKQKEEREQIFYGNGGELDYVACWYRKSLDYMHGHQMTGAFVSTNSICQGQQVAPLWKPLFDEGLCITFAYKTFVWNSESTEKAHVYCVIIGFANFPVAKKQIYSGNVKEVANINAYLMDAPNIFIEKRRKPLCHIPSMVYGLKPADNGNLILSDEEKSALVKKEPRAEKWIRPFLTAREYVHGLKRWCLWLEGITPAELKQLSVIRERIIACKEWRSQQKTSGDAYKLRDMPTSMRPSKKFHAGAYIVFPLHTGEGRRYIPMGFEATGAIPGNSVSIALDVTTYHFGVLVSNVHMAWMRAVCGRIKGDYRYSSDIVYNNFPWPTPTDAQREDIVRTAQGILDARALYPDSSLADLYDDVLMPKELREAHRANDRAVMRAYGFSLKLTESECVAELMKLYQALVEKAK